MLLSPLSSWRQSLQIANGHGWCARHHPLCYHHAAAAAAAAVVGAETSLSAPLTLPALQHQPHLNLLSLPPPLQLQLPAWALHLHEPNSTSLRKILTGKKKSSSLKKTSNKLLLLLLLLHHQLKKLQCVCVRVHLGWRLWLLPLQWEKSLPGKRLLISYPKSRKKELEGDFIFPSLTWGWEEATSSLTPLIWRHSSPQICFVLHKNSTQMKKNQSNPKRLMQNCHCCINSFS